MKVEKQFERGDVSKQVFSTYNDTSFVKESQFPLLLCAPLSYSSCRWGNDFNVLSIGSLSPLLLLVYFSTILYLLRSITFNPSLLQNEQTTKPS